MRKCKEIAQYSLAGGNVGGNENGSFPFPNALWIAYVRQRKSWQKKNNAQPIDDFQANIDRDKQLNQ